MNLTTATPREIDEKLADLSGARNGHYRALRSAFDTAHRLLGEKPETTRGGKIISWPTSDDDVAARLRNATVMPHEDRQRGRALTTIDSATHEIKQLALEISELEAEFQARGGWTRFFTVEDGHIHSARHCRGGSIRATTLVGWNPELSGKTEEEAVALLGPNLCTHCYPSAPVEWTRGVEKPIDPAYCTNKSPVAGSIRWRAVSSWAECGECGARPAVTSLGNLRKHKKPTN